MHGALKSKLILAWVCLFASAAAAAAVEVLSVPNAPPENLVAAQLIEARVGVCRANTAELQVRVAVGSAGLAQALASPSEVPVIAAFITSTEFNRASGLIKKPGLVTAIFSNPHPADQVVFARRLLGRPTLGFFDSPDLGTVSTELRNAQVVAIPAPAGKPVDALLRAAEQVDAIIALPDSSVLNQGNINHVVRALYQRRKVLIGYSETLTKVGSLGSVYVTPDAVAREVCNALDTFSAKKALPPPTFIREVEVSVNERLARSLNIALPDQKELERALENARAAEGSSE